MKKNLLVLLVALFVLNELVSCTEEKDPLSTDNKIIEVILGGTKSTPNGDTIKCVLPAGLSRDNLKLGDIVVSEGATIDPDKELPQNFTKPVDYYVTAADKRSARKYTIVVTAPNNTTPTVPDITGGDE